MSCIIVLGCFRSGTSAVAGILHNIGVMMGKDFDLPTSNNMSGYWEDIEFKSIHSKFVSAEYNDDKNVKMEYLELIRNREKDFEIWGLKDPLLCLTLPILLSNLNTKNKIIVCRRNNHEIASSMARSLGVSEENYLKFVNLAEFYVNSMNEHLLNYKGPILEMDHNQTNENPAFHIDRIANFLSLPVTKKSLDYIKKNNKNT